MSQAVLQAQGLSKSYGKLTAVTNLNLDVYRREVFGLLGPNGAGKTTSINMICGLLKPDAGQVYIHGNQITTWGADLKTRVGVCPQEIVLWKKLTCLEQLQFMGEMYGLGASKAREQGKYLLDQLKLGEKSNQLAKTLSGGMLRRLNLALALVHDPDIVLLDEPEAGLDPQSRRKVREYIKALAQEKTIILTTHNMDEAERMADRVAIMDHGELLVIDTPDALKRRVGEGDVLEISVFNQLDQAQNSLDEVGMEYMMTSSAGTLQLRALNIVSLLPMILEKLNRAGVQLGEVRLRENTLEDVFIQLTGRSLRE